MTSTRAVREDIQNALDYLCEADLCLAVNSIMTKTIPHNKNGAQIERISFTSHHKERFLISREHPDIEQYLAWLRSGAYSAVLFEGSLIQLTYDISQEGEVVSHRLAYMPCPYKVDHALLKQEPLQDAIELYEGSTDILLRSQIRFDFDPHSASPDHPAVHLTFNDPQCRIACIAPVHVMRFLDFIFRHFYPKQRKAHEPFFAPSIWRHLGKSLLIDSDRLSPHLRWDIHAAKSSVESS